MSTIEQRFAEMISVATSPEEVADLEALRDGLMGYNRRYPHRQWTYDDDCRLCLGGCPVDTPERRAAVLKEVGDEQ